jgi:hypothetical protein
MDNRSESGDISSYRSQFKPIFHLTHHLVHPQIKIPFPQSFLFLPQFLVGKVFE